MSSRTPITPTKRTKGSATQFGASSPTTGVEGAAELLNVHPKTVLELIDDCAIPAAKVGRAYTMLVRDVLSYLEKLIISQTSARMRSTTKAAPRGLTRASSRSASSSGGSCAR